MSVDLYGGTHDRGRGVCVGAAAEDADPPGGVLQEEVVGVRMGPGDDSEQGDRNVAGRFMRTELENLCGAPQGPVGDYVRFGIAEDRPQSVVERDLEVLFFEAAECGDAASRFRGFCPGGKELNLAGFIPEENRAVVAHVPHDAFDLHPCVFFFVAEGFFAGQREREVRVGCERTAGMNAVLAVGKDIEAADSTVRVSVNGCKAVDVHELAGVLTGGDIGFFYDVDPRGVAAEWHFQNEVAGIDLQLGFGEAGILDLLQVQFVRPIEEGHGIFRLEAGVVVQHGDLQGFGAQAVAREDGAFNKDPLPGADIQRFGAGVTEEADSFAVKPEQVPGRVVDRDRGLHADAVFLVPPGFRDFTVGVIAGDEWKVVGWGRGLGLGQGGAGRRKAQ